MSHTADRELQEIEKKYPGFIHMKLMEGIRLSYKLQVRFYAHARCEWQCCGSGSFLVTWIRIKFKTRFASGSASKGNGDPDQHNRFVLRLRNLYFLRFEKVGSGYGSAFATG
jgi:hypothetical protein